MLRPELDLGLQRVSAVLRALGDPHAAFPCVHVAGTNGKGSVVALVAAGLTAARARVGSFVSPFLCTPRDAVTVCGEAPTQEAWDAALAEVAAAAAGVAAAAGAVASVASAASDNASTPLARSTLTTFEAWTCAAFLTFCRASVDVAVVEVGVGGATDATNVLPPPLAAVVSCVSWDHVELLGPRLRDIAAHKAGIFKRGAGLAVTAAHQDAEVLAVLRDTAARAGLALVEALPIARGEGGGVGGEEPSGFPVALLGEFQLHNAALALAVLRHLHAHGAEARGGGAPALSARVAEALDDATIAAGFRACRWRGRLERVSVRVRGDGARVRVTLDGGHNAGAMEALGAAFARQAAHARAVELVFACSASRDVRANLDLLLPALAAVAPANGNAACALRPVRVLAVPFTPPEGMGWVRCHAPAAVAAAARAAADAAGLASCVTALACDSLALALERLAEDGAGCDNDGSVLRIIAGSLYLVSDVYRACDPIAVVGEDGSF